MKLITALVAFLLPTALAVFEDEAGSVDYYHALLGYPQRHATFFHRPQPASKASLIYTLSELDRLGAINPKDGSLLWRQQLTPGPNSNASFLLPGDRHVSIVSGVDGQIASWSAMDGKLIWNVQHDLPGTLVDLNSLVVDAAESHKDIVGLFHLQSGHSLVQRREGSNGHPIWQYTDTTSDTPFKVSTSGSKVFYISLHKTLLHGYKIQVTVLEARTGQKVDQYTLSSESDVGSPEEVQVEARGAYPVVVWADKTYKNLKVNVLGGKSITAIPIKNDAPTDPATKVVLHSVNDVSAPSHVLVEYQAEHAHWGDVIHVEGTGDAAKAKVKKAYEVVRLVGPGTIATTLTDGQLFFTRLAKGAFLVLSSAENKIVQSHTIRTFAPGIKDHPDPVLAIGEVNQKADGSYAVRTAALLSSGDFTLITNGPGAWTRREELAYIIDAKFAELPQKQSLAQQLAIEDHASVVVAYVHRLKRHIGDLKKLPKYLQGLPEKIISSIKGTTSETSSKNDLFGFNKYVVVLTSNKRVLAIDVADGGKVIWTNVVGGWTLGTVPTLTIAQGLVRVKNEEIHVIFDLATGTSLRTPSQRQSEAVASTKSREETIVEYSVLGNRIFGTPRGHDDPVWTFSPPPGSAIHSVTSRPASEPVASIGDVLGDRRVLYKYLNPNILLVIATNSETNTLSVYLLDSISGNTVHSTSHQSVDTTAPIPALFSENWLLYTYSIHPTPQTPSRGHLLTSIKLYESASPDSRGPLDAARNYSSLSPSSQHALSPYVASQTFHIPEPISHLSVSQTRQGITSRLILAYAPYSSSLLGIPPLAIDPRRPIGRDPTSTESSEGLLRSTASLEIDPKWILSHRLPLLNLSTILAEPATLESTSLVFAYGGDVFGTRVAPSYSFDVLGKDFNKGQLILTVVALTVACGVVAPLVGRKGNDLRWVL